MPKINGKPPDQNPQNSFLATYTYIYTDLLLA